MALREELVQIHKAYGHMTLDVSGTEALHPNGAALKAVPGFLGNRRSINTFIFMFLMMIKKQNSNTNILQTQYSNYNDTAQTKKQVCLTPFPS